MEYSNYSTCLLHETSDDWYECCVAQDNDDDIEQSFLHQQQQNQQQVVNETSIIKNPFAQCSLIPLPDELEEYHSHENQHFIRRRNERERTRVRNVNDGFERLRQHLPIEDSRVDKRLSKVETLRLAIDYIRHLEDILHSDCHFSPLQLFEN